MLNDLYGESYKAGLWTDEGNYVLYFAPEAAQNLLDKFQKAISDLADMPKMHSLVDEEPWRSEGVRKIVVKNFLIYFWVDDENMRVQVTAVIYQRRDQLARLADMEWE